MANHTLTEIHRSRPAGSIADWVVMWCTQCGAVVVDGEYDGRVFPGRYLPMRRPQATKANAPCDVRVTARGGEGE